MRSTTFAVIVGLAVALAWAGLARADGGLVHVTGKSPERERAIARKAIRDAIQAGGLSLVDKELSASESDAVTRCLRQDAAWSCVAGALRDKRIEFVAVVSVDPQGRTTKLSQRVVGTSIDSTFSGQRFCEQCTDDTLAVNATELTRELLDRIAIRRGRTVLSVKSTPQGARVTVDGNSAGTTDLSLDVPPGRHTVVIERDAYESATRIVDATEGQTAEVSVTLQAATAGAIRSDRTAEPPLPSRLLPGSVFVVGAATVVAGVVLVAIDQDPVTVRDKQVPPTYRDTAGLGIAAIALGAVATSTGAYLWRRTTRLRATAAITPTRTGALLSVAATF